MCDFNEILGWLAAADIVFIGAAIGMGIAAAANASGFGTPLGVAGYALAAAACVGAFFLIDQSADLLGSSACGSTACAAKYADALDKMRIVTVLAGTLAVGIVATAILSFLPFAGAIAMAATGAASVSLGVALGMAATALRVYQECVTSAPAPAATTAVEVLSWVAGFTLIGVGLTWIFTGNAGIKAAASPPPPID